MCGDIRSTKVEVWINLDPSYMDRVSMRVSSTITASLLYTLLGGTVLGNNDMLTLCPALYSELHIKLYIKLYIHIGLYTYA